VFLSGPGATKAAPQPHRASDRKRHVSRSRTLCAPSSHHEPTQATAKTTASVSAVEQEDAIESTYDACNFSSSSYDDNDDAVEDVTDATSN
jgi:hypothetical protein